MTDEELDLVETDRLVAALQRRFDGVLVATVSNLDEEREAREIWWRGGAVRSLGLAEYARHRISSQLNAPSLPGD